MSTRSKFVLTYVGGLVTGIILTFIALVLIAAYQTNTSSHDEDIVIFDTPQQELKVNSFEIFQVLPDGNALARIKDYSHHRTIVLFLAKEDCSYYDDQKIEVPYGKHVMQIGSYRYMTKQEFVKTVPIIDFLDNEE